MASCSSCGRDIGPGTGNGNVKGLCSKCAAERGVTDDHNIAFDTELIGGCLLKLLKAFGILMAISAVVWVVLFFAFDAYKIDFTVTGEAWGTQGHLKSYFWNMEETKVVGEIR